ncbi:MAG TPA: aminotransferase class V-fold PLP-dependent enzyme, partial [Bauldia sp.]|nr:aminotransferase class V-fold PLP-dependent enzyme [Bauldia sp.]
MSRTYLDYNATAPLRPEAREAVASALGEVGNASSVHAEGRAARARIEAARVEVARLVGGDPRYVTFTSGGTEANDTVLTPDWTFGSKSTPADLLFVGATEHLSVIGGGDFPPEAVHTIPVDGDGIVDLGALKGLLADAEAGGKRALVSVMVANNETGAIQPVWQVAQIAHQHGATVHADAVQAAGRIPIEIAGLGVDVLTLSAHKIGGPQGTGAIVRRGDDWTFAPLLRGGGQERRLRAGTENVAAIAGFGAAACAAIGDLGKVASWTAWRDQAAAIVGPKALIFSKAA